MMSDLSIFDLKGFEIIDSRGNFTVRAKVKLGCGVTATGDAPAGASKGSREVVELRDERGSVEMAVRSINYYISPALIGMDSKFQTTVDKVLINLDGTENKSRLGANAMVATSIAVSKAASLALGVETFMHLGGSGPHIIPVPLMNILNGGLHAGNNLKIQEFMIIPVGFDTLKEALSASLVIYKALKSLVTEKYGKIYTAVGDEGGISPPLSKTEDALELVHSAVKRSGYEDKVLLGLDPAASNFYNKKEDKYEIDGNSKTRQEMIDFYVSLKDRYPLLYVEDPFEENDFKSFTELQSKMKGVLVSGDDIYTTNVKYLTKGIESGATKAVIVKVNQIGTITEAMEFVNLAKRHSIKTVISHRSGETEDSFIADLAVAVNSEFIKTGAPARGERTSKYSRLLEIEKEFGFEYMGKKLA